MAKTLTLVLAADVGKFRRDMRQAEGGLSGFAGSIKNLVGPALIGATAAAGAFAVKLAVDGVKAAMDDEASLKSLAQTLENVGLAHQQPAVEEFISQMERSLGIADDQLRPAYDRLVRSTNNVEEANKALQIALDVSAGTGKDLSTVVEALGKAYDGNTGGLSRLGAGLDKATLSAGNLEQINTQLAKMFAGQATTAASTFEGQIARLETATDNLAEAFGQGLLKALGDTDEATTDLVKTLQDAEPALRDLGTAAGTLAIGTVDFFANITDSLVIFQQAMKLGGDEADELMKQLLFATTPEIRDMANEIRIANGEMQGFSVSARAVAGSLYGVANASYAAAQAVKNGEQQNRNDVRTQMNRNAAYQAWLAARREEPEINRSIGSSVTALEKPNERLIKIYELQSDAMDALREKFSEQEDAVREAQSAIDDYISTVASQLLGGLDLGAAYEGQFDENGKATGKTFLEAFNEQLQQSEWFGNVLQAIKAQGADTRLINEIASLGPAVGGALGQQLLDDGLVKTISEKYAGAVDAAALVGEAMVPEFLLAGEKSAIEMLSATAKQISDDLPKWAKVGKAIGKPIGANIEAEIAASVAAAVAAAQAAGEAARAEARAKEEARQAALTEQAIAADLARLIRNSDARAGRNVNPVVR